MKNIFIAIALILSTVSVSMAQQGFGTSTPDKSSVIDMTAGNKGALLPRVQLTGTTDVATIVNAANALTVFNTATVNDVTPGYYYWSLASNRWIRLLDQTNSTAGWGLTGNAGTIANTAIGANFIGTADVVPLNFRVGNAMMGWLGVPTAGNGTVGSSVYFGLNAGRAGAMIINAAYSNVAIGESALTTNFQGNSNVAIGANTLQYNANGSNNVAVGYLGLVANTYGSSNVGVGPSALWANTTGNFNTGLGISAGFNNALGSNNTFLGAFTDLSTTGLNLSNATAIGYNSKVSASNNLILGGTGTNAVNVGIGVTSATSTLSVNGSFSTAIRVTAQSTTLTDKDNTIIISTGVTPNGPAQTAIAQNSVIISLPQASTCKGRVYKIINANLPQNISSFDNTTAEIKTLISYGSSFDAPVSSASLSSTYGGKIITVQSDGLVWWLLN